MTRDEFFDKLQKQREPNATISPECACDGPATELSKLLHEIADQLEKEGRWPYRIDIAMDAVKITRKDAEWFDFIAGPIRSISVTRL